MESRFSIFFEQMGNPVECVVYMCFCLILFLCLAAGWLADAYIKRVVLLAGAHLELVSVER